MTDCAVTVVVVVNVKLRHNLHYLHHAAFGCYSDNSFVIWPSPL